MAIGAWSDNAAMICDLAALGYVFGTVLDPTYGLGRFWTRHTPTSLTACDLNPKRSPIGYPVDFRNMPFQDRQFDTVVFDPPYKLNGTGGSHASDEAYGVELKGVPWQDKMQLCRDGITECVRVLVLGGHLLVKCQDQVCSGAVRWQTRDFADHAESLGCRLVDMVHFTGHRDQPAGRRQVHARRNYSSMLVLRHVGTPTRKAQS